MSEAHSLIETVKREKAAHEISGLAVERGFEFASQIVSETATSVTCDFAYKSGSQWIESIHVLSAEYVATSRRVAEQQLVKAAVRLAQLLDVIASRFF